MATVHDRWAKWTAKAVNTAGDFERALMEWSDLQSTCVPTPLDASVQYVTYRGPDDWCAEVSTSPFFRYSPSDTITNTFRFSPSDTIRYMSMHSGQREAVGSEEPMYATKYDEEAFQDRFWDMVHHVQEQTTCTTEEAKEFVLKMMTNPTFAYSPPPAREEELDTTEAEKHLEELLS